MSGFNTMAELRASGSDSGTMPLLTQGFYFKTYLSVAMPKLVHDRFGMKATLPKGNGETVVWRRWLKLAINTTPLADGITPPGKKLAYENVTGAVKWYGDWVGITDQVQFFSPDPVLSIATRRLAEQSAETADVITRDVINAGTSFLRVTADGASPTVGVGVRTTVNGVLTATAMDSILTMFEAANATMFHGQMNASTKISTEPLAPAYIMIVHPHVAHSLKKLNTLAAMGEDWTPRERYAAGNVAYPTEIGSYRGFRILTSTLAKVWPDTGGNTTVGTTNNGTAVYRSTTGTTLGDVYSCLCLAKDAYGVVKLAGSSATYFNKAGGNADALHQRSTAGWKFAKTSVILNETYMARIEVLAQW